MRKIYLILSALLVLGCDLAEDETGSSDGGTTVDASRNDGAVDTDMGAPDGAVSDAGIDPDAHVPVAHAPALPVEACVGCGQARSERFQLLQSGSSAVQGEWSSSDRFQLQIRQLPGTQETP